MRLSLFSAVAVGLVAVGCQQNESVILLTLTADARVPAVSQIRITASNEGTSDIRLFPATVSAVPISFPSTLALVLPRSRSGTVDLAIDALNATMAVVANVADSVPITIGGRTEWELLLAPGASPCGNHQIDKGETCDDGNQISGDDCSFECLEEAPVDGGAPDANKSTADSSQPANALDANPSASSDAFTAMDAKSPPADTSPAPDTAPPGRALGDACINNNQCASRVCTGSGGSAGICCDRQCDGKCRACSNAGKCIDQMNETTCAPTTCAGSWQTVSECVSGICTELKISCAGTVCSGSGGYRGTGGCDQFTPTVCGLISNGGGMIEELRCGGGTPKCIYTKIVNGVKTEPGCGS